MSVSVAGKISHRLPRPQVCTECRSTNIALQKRSFMGRRTHGEWDLIWHCGDCDAMVGCHEGTDVPLGTMANAETRGMRLLAHEAFDPMWRGRNSRLSRDDAYEWMAVVLGVPIANAHIGMLDRHQCELLINAVRNYKPPRPLGKELNGRNRHWRERTRKRRRP